MLVLITGEPNTGKSYIMDHLQSQGTFTFKVDDYINEIYQAGRIGYQVIKEAFGPYYVNAQEVDKHALGELILEDEAARRKLQHLIWPLIVDTLKNLRRQQPDGVVEMGIYLIDPPFFQGLFDFVIEVRREPHLRTVNYKTPLLDLYAHAPRLRSDFVINNNWSLPYVERLVDELFKII